LQIYKQSILGIQKNSSARVKRLLPKKTEAVARKKRADGLAFRFPALFLSVQCLHGRGFRIAAQLKIVFDDQRNHRRRRARSHGSSRGRSRVLACRTKRGCAPAGAPVL
jgi:hypothetical protein